MTRTPTATFGEFVATAHAAGQLVVQPRMGFADPRQMREGLRQTKLAAATTVGTLTLDSYTRMGDTTAATEALAAGLPLNGYPITIHSAATTRAMLEGIQGHSFPVQVRHGSANPADIIDSLINAGMDATEGGPVSYCLPYSRMPLRVAVDRWAHACDQLAALQEQGKTPHLETFGGCLMGQLCPPSMLVAISVLEGIFFAQHGIQDISLSYAQQVNPEQDAEAVAALRRLAGETLSSPRWHVVLYTYMGLYPRTRTGASRLLERAAQLAVHAGAARLIVKTIAESNRIPTIHENVAALELASSAAARTDRTQEGAGPTDTGIYAEARALVDAVLEMSTVLEIALPRAFQRGCLDIPYCLHPDNPGRVRSIMDESGRLQWAATGGLPIRPSAGAPAAPRLTAGDLVLALSRVQRTFDEEPAGR